jgi:hypothetical protein
MDSFAAVLTTPGYSSLYAQAVQADNEKMIT